MDILIISHFGSTYSDTDNDRFLYLAKELSKEHCVEIVTSTFCHEKKMHRSKPEFNWNFKISFIDEPGYKKNVCLKRFFSHFIWGINVNKYLKTRKKPDVIYCAVPSLTASLKASKYCKKTGKTFVIDIQDLWPEAFRMVFNIPVISDLIFIPFTFIANKIYKRADEVVAVSQSYLNRAMVVNKKCKKGRTVFLGTDLDFFDQYMSEESILKKNGEEKWLAYCGTLGSSYDLSNVLKALSIVKKRRYRVPRFVIMGDGPLKDKFVALSDELEIDCCFVGRLPYNQMCILLKKCDIAVNPIMHNAAQSIINKHADYVASGLPIISTQENKEFQNLITRYNMGYNCENSNPNELADKLILLISDEEKRKEMGLNARKCAEELFDRKVTYKELINIILKGDKTNAV